MAVVSYPVTHLMLTTEDVDSLRRLHAAGHDLAVLARARELDADAAEPLRTELGWAEIDSSLRGYYLIHAGESVFGRRDFDIKVLDAGRVASTGAALAAVSRDWLRERFTERVLQELPGPIQRPSGPGFDEVWARFTRLTGFFARANREQRPVLFFSPSRFWRPPRVEPGPDGKPRVIRPHYRPQDYTVDTNATRTLPADGGSWAFDADLDERDGVLYSWTEVDRFTRGGRTWVRMTVGSSEYYIDVENADGRIGRIEAVDPLIAYWIARRGDKYPVVLED